MANMDVSEGQRVRGSEAARRPIDLFPRKHLHRDGRVAQVGAEERGARIGPGSRRQPAEPRERTCR